MCVGSMENTPERREIKFTIHACDRVSVRLSVAAVAFRAGHCFGHAIITWICHVCVCVLYVVCSVCTCLHAK